MSKFYIPELIKVCSVPVIVYPCEGIDKLVDRRDHDSIKRHLEKLYRNNALGLGEFNIDMLWTDKNDLMTDIWSYAQLQQWGSGALVQADTFRNLTRDTTCGTTAEYGLSVLGREADHRLWVCGNEDIERFLNSRPVLHPCTTNDERFYQD